MQLVFGGLHFFMARKLWSRLGAGYSFKPMPDGRYKLVVFDLDFTLWDAGGVWCDCLRPPFRKDAIRVVDRNNAHIRLYDDVHWAMDTLDHLGVEMAVASRTEQPSWARELLELLGIRHRFAWEEIYPSSKVRHFEALSQNSGYEYREMLFFDDERRNIVEVGAMGVKAIEVSNGFSRALLESEMKR